jgi:hypothetical protein
MMPRAQSTLQIALVDSIYSVGFIRAVATCDGLGFREFSKRSTYLSTTVVDHPTARLYVCSDTAWLRLDGGDATPTMRLLPPSAKAAF